jgi:hypothetical protein
VVLHSTSGTNGAAQIARRMLNAEHIHLVRSSHFWMLERPEVVIPAMRRFLTQRPRW